MPRTMDRLADEASLSSSLDNLLHDSFADLARLHDALLSVCAHCYERPSLDEQNKDAALVGKAHRDAVKAGNYGRAADVVKATMFLRFPEGADTWFEGRS